LNPACKLRQPLPTVPLILEAKSDGRLNVPVADVDKKLMPAAMETPRSGLISSCKNFAFSNLF
jgi:hypothetical protein